jgi:hypothetical protein
MHCLPMSSTSSIPPTIPFHVAQAYGARPAAAARATAGAQATQISEPAAPQRQAGPSAKLSSAAQKLVGATVPGRVDFSGPKPTQTTEAPSLQLYRHPAEKNAAATAVSIGRSLDVRG